LTVGTLAINALLPPTRAGETDQASASPTYTTSLNGNQARLFDPIPRVCGRHRVVPPFAAQPYAEYDPNNGDQFYYAIFAIGFGEHEIEAALIDDTPLTNFQDVLLPNNIRSGYLPPGTLPGAVSANVVTAPEVSSFFLDTNLTCWRFFSLRTRKTSQ
jgi:hypothetical protein